ncbi:MAG: phospholipase [Phycisphaerae bacterium]|nr:phospholipase [Gemmatimonadaceae bacterium]
MAANSLHQSQSPLLGGAPLASAKAAIVLVHGRGGDAEGMLDLGLVVADDSVALIALRATHNTWYPERFMAPLANNEPWLTSALQAVSDGIGQAIAAGVSREHIMLLGFSQGACLSLEFAARNAVRYGAVAALSGGLIGPDDTPRDYQGSLAGTPVFLGCSDIDGHIPVTRVRESATIMQSLGGVVDTRIYGGMGHEIIDDEVNAVRTLVGGLLASPR